MRLYEYANCGNHLHLLIRVPGRAQWAAFIREIAGRIARLMGGAKFWLHKPFTRVLASWGREYRTVKAYVRLNNLESQGLARREEIRFLNNLRKEHGSTV